MTPDTTHSCLEYHADMTGRTGGARLQDKVAVVTGASLGIGAAIASAFAAEGAAVVVNYGGHHVEATAIVDGILERGGRAVTVQADMRDEAQIARLMQEAIQRYGRLDVLVNNAGVFEFKPLAEIDLEHFRHHFELNVLGYLRATRAAVEHFGTAGASIVNIGSTVTREGPAQGSVYTATKGAIDGLTKSLANELAPRGIRVNVIKAGVIKTEGLEKMNFLDSQYGKDVVDATPLGRVGMPIDVALAAVYLASDEAAWVTGEEFVVAGGSV